MGLREKLGLWIAGKTGDWERNLMRRMGALSGWEADDATFANDLDYLESLQRASWVYACVACIADNFTVPHWHFERRAGKKKQESVEIPELVSLLRHPTPWYGMTELLEATIAYLLLTGKAYWYLDEIDLLSTLQTYRAAKEKTMVALSLDGKPLFKVPEDPVRGGIPKQIWYLRPDLVTPKMSGPGEEFRLFKEFVYEPTPGRKYTLPAGAVIYFRRFDPLYMTEGLGVVEAARLALETDQNAVKWNRRFFRNAARPDLILSSDQSLSEDEMERYAAEWDKRFRGPDKAHKTAILGGGVKPFPFSINPKDMDFLKLRQASREEILSMFRVPPAKLGFYESNALGNSNVREQDRIFWGECMEPHMRRFADKVSAELVTRYDPDAEFVFEDMTPADLDLQSQVAARLIASGVWSPNEAREQLGLGEPYDGGDRHFIPATFLPLAAGAASALAAMEENAGAEKELAGPRRLAPGRLRNGKVYRKSLSQADWEHTERQFRIAALKEFQEQEREVVRALGESEALAELAGKSRRKAEGDEAEGDLEEEVAGIVAALVAWDAIKQRFGGRMRTKYAVAMQLAGDIALADLGISGKFDIDDPKVQGWLDRYIPHFSDQVTGTTESLLIAALLAGLAAGATIGELTERAREVFRHSKNERSEKIARSEANRALHQGELQAWRQSGIVAAKQWTFGPNPCDYCLDMGDRVVEINEAFFAVGDHFTNSDGATMEVEYWDIESPPLHSDCKCDFLPILAEEER